jgi:hypothetical protein
MRRRPKREQQRQEKEVEFTLCMCDNRRKTNRRELIVVNK